MLKRTVMGEGFALSIDRCPLTPSSALHDHLVDKCEFVTLMGRGGAPNSDGADCHLIPIFPR
jgi:hypothetical protein